jgi:hypothetical protein
LKKAVSFWFANRKPLAKWRAIEADGDPLGFAANLREGGILAQLAEAILAAGPGATEPLQAIKDRLRFQRYGPDA